MLGLELVAHYLYELMPLAMASLALWTAGTPWEAPTDEASALLNKLRIGTNGQPMKQRRLNTAPADLCLADALEPLTSAHPHEALPSMMLHLKVPIQFRLSFINLCFANLPWPMFP